MALGWRRSADALRLKSAGDRAFAHDHSLARPIRTTLAGFSIAASPELLGGLNRSAVIGRGFLEQGSTLGLVAV